MNKKIIFTISGSIVIITITVLFSINYQPSQWASWNDNSRIEPPPDPIMFSPSQKDIDFVASKTNSSKAGAISALIESDNNVQKAIQYLNK